MANFNQELQKQFALSNTEKKVRARLRRLKEMGSVRNYINEFTTLMLKISDMSNKDSLFNFQDSLNNCAKIELDKWGVQTLDDAIVIAIVKSLTEYST